MTPDSRVSCFAQMEAYGIDPESKMGRDMIAAFEDHDRPRLRLVVNGEYRPRIVLPTITGTRLAAERATNNISVSSSRADVTEAGQSSSGPASDRFELALKIIAILLFLGAGFMFGSVLTGIEAELAAAGRV